MAGYNNWPLIINLGNSIIGVAVLAMPFCFKQCGILLGMLTLLFCTWLTLCSCSLLMKAGIISRRRSYEFLAYHTHGATGKFVSEVGMIGMQMGTLIAQIVVIGDLGPAIISKLLGIENTSNLRTWILILLCLGVGLPMGLLKDLRTVSRGSTICIAFYCIFVIYILLMSIPNLWTGDWYFKVNFWRPQGLFQCLPILSFSFGCQTQLFLVYEELPEPSLKDISGVISSAVNLCAVAYLLVGFFGYITFHAVEVPGDILAALPATFVADVMKLCFVFSIVITFPVIIFPCRASIYTLLFAKKTKAYDDSLEGSTFIPENTFKVITISIILVSMITGILIPNVEFILGMNGAIMGTLICYIFPALFFIKVIGDHSEGKTRAQLVLFLGVTILLVSTFATLSSQDKGHTHIDVASDQLAKPEELDIKGLDRPMPVHPTVNQNLGDPGNKDMLADADKTIEKEKEKVVETRKEPPIPDPPMSNDKDIPAKADLPVKKRNGSDVKVRSVNNEEKGKEKEKKAGDTDEADLDAKKKELEEEHKAKELELKEKEKKQEEILEKLEKHRQDQEKLLKEQIEVLKELKSHKEKDETKDEMAVKEKEEELDKKEEGVKDEIVKRQQELLDQQQKVNQQQQELIQQQQQQINQQLLKDQKIAQVTVKAPQVVAQQQQVLDQQQQAINVQQMNAQQPAINAQQPLMNAQLPVMNAQQPVMNAQQPAINAQQPAMNAQQPVMNAQQPAINAQQPAMNAQQPAINAQQPVMNAQQPAVNAQQQVMSAQQLAVNAQQVPNLQAVNQQGINQQPQQQQQVLNQQQANLQVGINQPVAQNPRQQALNQQQQALNPQLVNQGLNLQQAEQGMAQQKQIVDSQVVGLNQQQVPNLNAIKNAPEAVIKRG